jgi:hypothetical protein
MVSNFDDVAWEVGAEEKCERIIQINKWIGSNKTLQKWKSTVFIYPPQTYVSGGVELQLTQ